MAHFAKIDNLGIVATVLSGSDSDTELSLCARTDGTYRQTSYNTKGGIHYTDGVPSSDQSKAFRKNYAGIGYSYDQVRDAFISPKQYQSWVLNEDTCQWDAPTAMPSDGKRYTWNESTKAWDEIE